MSGGKRPQGDSPLAGEVFLYPTPGGSAEVECRFSGETVWLTQALMAALFDKDVRTINEHLQNLYDGSELDPEATIRKFRIVRREGERQVAKGRTISAVGHRAPK